MAVDLDDIRVRGGPPAGEVPAVRSITQQPYSPERHRESARLWVAFWLLGILTLLVLATFVALWGAWATIAELDTILKIMFGPLITLVGTMAGFYFGAASAE